MDSNRDQLPMHFIVPTKEYRQPNHEFYGYTSLKTNVDKMMVIMKVRFQILLITLLSIFLEISENVRGKCMRAAFTQRCPVSFGAYSSCPSNWKRWLLLAVGVQGQQLPLINIINAFLELLRNRSIDERNATSPEKRSALSSVDRCCFEMLILNCLRIS